MFQIKIAGKEVLSFGRNAETTLTGAKILELFGGATTASGVSVNEEKAIGLSAVYSAVRVISESLAVLPLQVFKRTSKGRDLMYDHPLYRILHDEPNTYQTAFTWRETGAAHQCLWGNAYSYIQRDALGRIFGLIPIEPSWMEPKLDTKRNKIFYVLNGKDVIEQSNIIHTPALSFDGIKGKSPVQLARESYGLAFAQETYGAKFFGNGANLNGVITHPGKISEKALKNLQASWNKKYGGIDNAQKTAILEEGMKLEKMSVPPEEAQFLESRKFQINEVARWFRIPPHLLADLDRATFNSVEQLDIGFIKYSLSPWLKRWEQELNRKLLTEDEKKDHYIEFNVEGFLRGDVKTRTEYYSKMIASRVLNPNEVRRMENRNDYEGGDEYANPNTTTSKEKESTD